MRPDIVNLRQFYSSRIGRKVKQRLRRLVRSDWPALKGDAVVGIGYAPPLLSEMDRADDDHGALVALMPVSQGAIYWPVSLDNRSVLADELRPPFAPSSLQRVVMVHAFEHVARPDELLQIYWQLLAPGGRLLLVVPNRRGVWASMGATPFSQGIPYTLSTVKELLRDADFTLRETHTALFAPPSSHPFWLHSWAVFEWLGRIVLPGFGGVLMIEAEKQIYAGIQQPVLAPKRAPNWLVQPSVGGFAQ
jgi:SAM-dependent methyltransferase